MAVAPLCQRGGASCGACCGLYNREDFSRPAVRALLSHRTRALAEVPRTKEAFTAAGRALARDDATPIFPSVRVCPLLGFLDAEETRIGCLAHPLATGGVDLRDCGAYDAGICSSFFCPSHAWLTDGEAAIAALACGDFHLYGLVVTDVPFLRACLAGIAAEAGARVELRHVEEPRFRGALRGLLAVKEELAPGSDGLYGAFRPGTDGEDAEPRPRAIDYVALGRSRPAGSWLDEILTCAGADPRSGNDLDRLEELVRARLAVAVAALPGGA
jgi:hypothetical protein